MTIQEALKKARELCPEAYQVEVTASFKETDGKPMQKLVEIRAWSRDEAGDWDYLGIGHACHSVHESFELFERDLKERREKLSTKEVDHLLTAEGAD